MPGVAEVKVFGPEDGYLNICDHSCEWCGQSLSIPYLEIDGAVWSMRFHPRCAKDMVQQVNHTLIGVPKRARISAERLRKMRYIRDVIRRQVQEDERKRLDNLLHEIPGSTKVCLKAKWRHYAVGEILYLPPDLTSAFPAEWRLPPS